MLDKLKDHYRQSLHAKIEAIKLHLQALRQGEAEAEQQLRILAHSLHGSGSTYGFPDISLAAKKVEYAEADAFLKDLTVLITILQDTASMPQQAQEETQDLPQAGNKVLLIEDDPDISSLLELVLKEKFIDHEFDLAASALDAEKRFRAEVYALIILDLVLPDSDGRVLLRTIKTGPNRNTPVFVLSSMDNTQVRQECLSRGASHFFKKPFDPGRIASEMQQVLFAQAPGSDLPSPGSGQTAWSAKIPENNTVLVAEDDELLAAIIKHRLGREGLTVEHVEDGQQALDAIGAGDYGLVILDVKMPVIDGFEVLDKIRHELDDGDTPVIMLTAMGSEQDIVRGYELGATDYILKPFSPVELIARVKSLLRETNGR